MWPGDSKVVKSATFVDNRGLKFSKMTPIKFGNVWVVGQDNLEGWFKMVSFNKYGN
jgi:hypothetical protein